MISKTVLRNYEQKMREFGLVPRSFTIDGSPLKIAPFRTSLVAPETTPGIAGARSIDIIELLDKSASKVCFRVRAKSSTSPMRYTPTDGAPF